jgi:hypothetical protein
VRETGAKTVAKLRVKFKLQGLEFEVEGSREEIPLVGQQLAEQFASLIAPVTAVATGDARPALSGATAAAAQAATPTKSARKRTTKSGGSGNGSTAKETATDWRHDTARYGSPTQSWSAADKALWLLYVVAREANVSELTTGGIVATLGKHFRPSGAVRPSNLARDLNRLKVARNGRLPLVSEDTSKTPSTWFLTDAGTAHAQTLVTSAVGANQQA